MTRKRKSNSTLGRELDYLWRKANHQRLDWRVKTEDWLNILCFRLGVSPINLYVCSIEDSEECRARHSGNNPCGGACYKRGSFGNGRIYVRTPFAFNHETALHELLHHINAENKNQPISAIMCAWFNTLYKKRTGYRKFLKQARENGKK